MSSRGELQRLDNEIARLRLRLQAYESMNEPLFIGEASVINGRLIFHEGVDSVASLLRICEGEHVLVTVRSIRR